MNVQEAIALANELYGSDYFSPAQPAFFVEAARSAGDLDVSAKDPNAPRDWTRAEVERIVATCKQGQADDQAQVRRDYDMTAKTTRSQRCIVDDLISDVSEAYLDKTGEQSWLDRPIAFRWCAGHGVTIYTERWRGKRDGDDFILQTERQKVFDGLMRYLEENSGR